MQSVIILMIIELLLTGTFYLNTYLIIWYQLALWATILYYIKIIFQDPRFTSSCKIFDSLKAAATTLQRCRVCEGIWADDDTDTKPLRTPWCTWADEENPGRPRCIAGQDDSLWSCLSPRRQVFCLDTDSHLRKIVEKNNKINQIIVISCKELIMLIMLI